MGPPVAQVPCSIRVVPYCSVEHASDTRQFKGVIPMKLAKLIANSPYIADGNKLEEGIAFAGHGVYTPIGQLTNDITQGRDCWDEYRQVACRTYDALQALYAN